MKRIADKRNIKTLIILALLTILALFIFFPRNLARLAETKDTEIESVTLHGVFIPGKDAHVEIELSREQTAELLTMLESTYVFLSPFSPRYVRGDSDYVGYLFEMPRTEENGVPPMLSYFTRQTICVDGVSYRFYGNAFANWFAEFIA